MDQLELVRVAVAEEGAFGVLLQDNLPFAVTLERTFGDADRIVIPPGDHKCRSTTFFKKGYPTYEVAVPGHKRVLFHIGNLEEDSTGCILVGLEFGAVEGKWGVLLSRLGFREFMKRAAGCAEFLLRVREVES